jgi:hypothetical protein
MAVTLERWGDLWQSSTAHLQPHGMYAPDWQRPIAGVAYFSCRTLGGASVSVAPEKQERGPQSGYDANLSPDPGAWRSLCLVQPGRAALVASNRGGQGRTAVHVDFRYRFGFRVRGGHGPRCVRHGRRTGSSIEQDRGRPCGARFGVHLPAENSAHGAHAHMRGAGGPSAGRLPHDFDVYDGERHLHRVPWRYTRV